MRQVGPPISELTPEQREEWEERAAILEFDAGLPRERAEWDAFRLVTRKVLRDTKC